MIDQPATETTDAVRLEQRIAAPPETVFEFLVDPEKLVRWLGTEADIEPEPGGRLWLNVTGDEKAEGSYVEVDPPRRVSFTWGWLDSEDVPPGSSLVVIDLVADGTDTVVTLTHSGLPGGRDDEHRQGWEYFLSRLLTAGEGGDPGPLAPPGE